MVWIMSKHSVVPIAKHVFTGLDTIGLNARLREHKRVCGQLRGRLGCCKRRVIVNGHGVREKRA